MIVTNDYKFSSNINEVIRSVLNFLFFFLQKDFTSTKKHKTAYSEQKIKITHKKHLRRKKLLIRLFAFCAFILLVLLVKTKSLNGLKKLVFMSLPVPLN